MASCHEEGVRFQVAWTQYTHRDNVPQLSPQLQMLADIFAQLEDTALLQRLEAYRLVGRKGHSLRAMWRAYVLSFLLNVPTTNAMIRELHNRPDLLTFCGFKTVPNRCAFGRFINRLSTHANLVEQVMVGVTSLLKKFLPDLGEVVAVDSTVVSSNSRPRIKDRVTDEIIRESSDPQADWAPKHSPRAKKNGQDWFWGFKLHMLADAIHGLPLAQFTSAANLSDNPTLPVLVEYVERMLSWCKPKVVIGDRGYDDTKHHHYLVKKGIIPILHIRRPSNTDWYDGVYTKEGVPTCIGQVPMSFVKTDPKTGHHLYRCTGCHLKNRRGVHYCKDEVWEDPTKNLRLFGAVRRGSKEWKAYYSKRQGIERVFKSMKESRRLDSHCHRGLRRVNLHCVMSALTFQATALANSMAGRPMRWMVRKLT